MRGIVRAALETVQPSAEAKGINIHTDVDSSIGSVLGDAARLQQILSNLLTNAVKFAPDAGAVRLAIQRTDNVVEMVVSDNGKASPRISYPWYSKRSVRRTDRRPGPMADSAWVWPS
jgi:signal transduction histidine kinase